MQKHARCYTDQSDLYNRFQILTISCTSVDYKFFETLVFLPINLQESMPGVFKFLVQVSQIL